MKWFADNGMTVLATWPAYSPDLSPIENLWALIKRELGKEKEFRFRGTTREQLWKLVQKAHAKITAGVKTGLVASLENRLKACRKAKRGKAKGGPTQY